MTRRALVHLYEAPNSTAIVPVGTGREYPRGEVEWATLRPEVAGRKAVRDPHGEFRTSVVDLLEDSGRIGSTARSLMRGSARPRRRAPSAQLPGIFPPGRLIAAANSSSVPEDWDAWARRLTLMRTAEDLPDQFLPRVPCHAPKPADRLCHAGAAAVLQARDGPAVDPRRQFPQLRSGRGRRRCRLCIQPVSPDFGPPWSIPMAAWSVSSPSMMRWRCWMKNMKKTCCAWPVPVKAACRTG